MVIEGLIDGEKVLWTENVGDLVLDTGEDVGDAVRNDGDGVGDIGVDVGDVVGENSGGSVGPRESTITEWEGHETTF